MKKKLRVFTVLFSILFFLLLFPKIVFAIDKEDEPILNTEFSFENRVDYSNDKINQSYAKLKEYADEHIDEYKYYFVSTGPNTNTLELYLWNDDSIEITVGFAHFNNANADTARFLLKNANKSNITKKIIYTPTLSLYETEDIVTNESIPLFIIYDANGIASNVVQFSEDKTRAFIYDTNANVIFRIRTDVSNGAYAYKSVNYKNKIYKDGDIIFGGKGWVTVTGKEYKYVLNSDEAKKFIVEFPIYSSEDDWFDISYNITTNKENADIHIPYWRATYVNDETKEQDIELYYDTELYPFPDFLEYREYKQSIHRKFVHIDDAYRLINVELVISLEHLSENTEMTVEVIWEKEPVPLISEKSTYVRVDLTNKYGITLNPHYYNKNTLYTRYTSDIFSAIMYQGSFRYQVRNIKDDGKDYEYVRNEIWQSQVGVFSAMYYRRSSHTEKLQMVSFINLNDKNEFSYIEYDTDLFSVLVHDDSLNGGIIFDPNTDGNITIRPPIDEESEDHETGEYNDFSDLLNQVIRYTEHLAVFNNFIQLLTNYAMLAMPAMLRSFLIVVLIVLLIALVLKIGGWN